MSFILQMIPLPAASTGLPVGVIVVPQTSITCLPHLFVFL